MHTVVIATHNRAADLRGTLRGLRRLTTTEPWELIVVDNNCTDDTRAVIESEQVDYPVRLTYVFEGEQGRLAALNAGFRAGCGDLILTTDDDVVVSPDWLDQGVTALRRHGCAFVGGRVLPKWSVPPPSWIPDGSGRHWVPLALFDLGPEPLEFRTCAPLGVNMGLRREALARAGGFDNQLGRKAGTLLGQEVREWCMRVRAAGMTGHYEPAMVVHHHVPSHRLNKRYFRSSFYWRGVSRAILYQKTGADVEAPEETLLDFAQVPHIAGVPRYLYRSCLSEAASLARALARRDRPTAFDAELQLCFYAGMFHEIWRAGARRRSGGPGSTTPAPTS